MFKIENPYIDTLHPQGFTIKDCERQSFFHLSVTLRGATGNEAHVSAQQPEAEEQARLPGKNENEGREESPGPPEEKGTTEADRQR